MKSFARQQLEGGSSPELRVKMGPGALIVWANGQPHASSANQTFLTIDLDPDGKNWHPILSPDSSKQYFVEAENGERIRLAQTHNGTYARAHHNAAGGLVCVVGYTYDPLPASDWFQLGWEV